VLRRCRRCRGYRIGGEAEFGVACDLDGLLVAYQQIVATDQLGVVAIDLEAIRAARPAPTVSSLVMTMSVITSVKVTPCAARLPPVENSRRHSCPWSRLVTIFRKPVSTVPARGGSRSNGGAIRERCDDEVRCGHPA